MLTLNELFDMLRSRDTQLTYGLQPGVVRENDDPDGIGAIRCEFPFNAPGTVHAPWLPPVHFGSGDIGFPPPEKGDFVLVQFLDGNLSDGFYFGLSRGVPQQKDVRKLMVVDEAELHAAIGEITDKNFKAFLKAFSRHTHQVTVKGVSTMPGSPIMLTGKTFTPEQAPPQLITTQARYVTFRKRNKKDDPL